MMWIFFTNFKEYKNYSKRVKKVVQNIKFLKMFILKVMISLFLEATISMPTRCNKYHKPRSKVNHHDHK